MKKKTSISLDEDVKLQLESLAQKIDRSVSWIINAICVVGADAAEKSAAKSENFGEALKKLSDDIKKAGRSRRD